MPRDGGGQPAPHFQSEDLKTQLLSLPHLIKVTGPPDLNALQTPALRYPMWHYWIQRKKRSHWWQYLK